MISRGFGMILLLLTLALGACSPVVPVTPAAEPAATSPTATEELAAETPVETPAAVGIYKAFMPGASSPGLDMTLYLNADGTLRLVNDYQNEEAPFVEEGTWRAEGDQVTITLAGAQSRTFTLADGRLESADWIGPWHEFTGLATGVTPPYEAEALAQLFAYGTASGDAFGGFFKAFSPSASCCGLDQTLLLAVDGSARLTSDYLNGEAPIVETGTWEMSEDGPITVTLSGRADGTDYEAPVVLVLVEEEGRLVTVEADASQFGEGLVFYYFPGLALPNMN